MRRLSPAHAFAPLPLALGVLVAAVVGLVVDPTPGLSEAMMLVLIAGLVASWLLVRNRVAPPLPSVVGLARELGLDSGVSLSLFDGAGQLIEGAEALGFAAGDRPDDPLERVHDDDRAEVRDWLEAARRGETCGRKRFRVGMDDDERRVEGRVMDLDAPLGTDALVLLITDDHSHDARPEHAVAATGEERSGLSNRRELVEDYVRRSEAAVGDAGVGVLFIDVDRFKATNDSLGRDYGDELLRALGRRIQRTVRPGDTVGSLGADEFLVLCDGGDHPDEAVGLAKRIHEVLARPFTLVDRTVTVTVSIGVALSDAPCAEAAFSDADIAMMRAKSEGGNSTVVFAQSLRSEVAERAVIEQELRRAMDDEQLRLVYQPIVDLVEGRMAAVEALVRWEHPDRGRLSPAAFLPVAEETGLIVPLGDWVLAEACRAQVSWRVALGDQAPTVTVNLSLRQLLTPDFVARVRLHVVTSGIDPSHLILEVTEDSLVNELERCIPLLSELAALGVGIAIDDFGTGMSSLSYVKRLPMARTLKLDRSFISDIHEYRTDHAIVQAVLVMTDRLGIRVVAEGVETTEPTRCSRGTGRSLRAGLFLQSSVGGRRAGGLQPRPGAGAWPGDGADRLALHHLGASRADQRPGRHVAGHHAAGSDDGALPDGDVTHHHRIGAELHSVAHHRTARRAAAASHVADGHPLAQHHVGPQHRGGVDHQPLAVSKPEPGAHGGAGGKLDAQQPVDQHPIGHQGRCGRHSMRGTEAGPAADR
ncbi:MAG: bifunctional diguanylate cyclase/phosphodiesterase [Microthrixaceae bacterium]